jgi:metallo-beta-lactamase family protein
MAKDKQNSTILEKARLSFFGATGTVTGSRHFLELRKHNFLIDCGLFQGPKENRQKNWDPFPVSPQGIDNVLLTHAHIDHSGYLPKFCNEGFHGKVLCTKATARLCEIMLKDSAHLQEEDARWANKKGFSRHKPALPLYTVKDAERALTHFDPVQYGEGIYFEDDLRIKFKDAGHILGSSFIDIKSGDSKRSRKIVFSGDLGRPAEKYLREPVQPFNVDYLVIESTYGDRLHDQTDPREELTRIIKESVERGGVLIIPSFAVGRTQTLLFIIRELEEQGKIEPLPIYMDSPMAIGVTNIFKDRITDQNISSRVLILEGKQIFQPKKLHICEEREQSIAINKIDKGAIIISASGMVTGGRILYHIANRLPDKKNTVLFIGYQAEGTRGRAITEGKPEVKIHGQMVPVNAHVENISGLSAHADYNEILAWLLGFNKPPLKTFIVHGEKQASAALAEKIQGQLGWDVVIPKFGESFELDF